MDLKIPTQHLSRISEVITISFKLMKLVWLAERWVLVGTLVAVLIPAIIPFVNAYIFKLVIDLAAASFAGGSFDYSKLYLYMGIFLGVSYIGRMAFTYQAFSRKIFYIKLPLFINQLVLNKIASLDLQHFENSDFHDILQKVRDNYTWRPHQAAFVILMLSQSMVQVLIALVAIVHLNVFLALLLTLVAIPDLINQVLFSKFSWNIWDHKVAERKRFGYTQSLLQRGDSIKELKIFGVKNRFLKEIYNLQLSHFLENRKLAIKELKINSLFNVLESFIFVGVLGYIILQAVLRKITLGDISFYQSVIGNFNNGLGGLFSNLSQTFEHSLYMKSIFDLLEIEPTIKQVENPLKVDFNKTPIIEFRNVSFKYPDAKRYILKDFNLLIKPGDKVAFVGENGAGKTTLIKLLGRFYDVSEGEILIDGVNLKELDLESWYKSLGILFQDFIHYEYPAKDNIFFGRVWEEENLEKIIDAAKGAGAHEMIKKFDDEYAQMLGKTFEGGQELSGGQWQKIALARAFFRNAPVLILDEPTASIDAKAESEIFNRVEKLAKDKTVIIISHRFSTVRNADKIYVIENGKIVESGDHKSLMKLDGQYATLFNLQAKGYQ